MPTLPDPLHPAVVHLPLALALLMPLVFGVVALGMKTGFFQPRTWLLALLLQLALLGGAWFATETGEREEETVEKVVGHAALEAHEEAAEVFLYAAAGAAALALLTFFLLGSPRGRGWGSLLSTLGALAVLWFALETGDKGGKLVYQHGAATAYPRAVEGPTPPAPEGD